MGNKTITAVAMAAMAVAGLSQASTPISSSPVLDSRATSNTPPYPPASDVAEQAATRFLDFVAGLSSTADITQAAMERAFHLSLSEIRPGTHYAKRQIGAGWIYSVAYRAPQPDTKPGFALRFYNKDLTADPTPVCAWIWIESALHSFPVDSKNGYSPNIMNASTHGTSRSET